MKPYTIRPSPESRLELRVAKTGFLSGKQHLFVFESYRGMLHYTPENPEGSRVSLTIDAGSAVCKDTWVSAKDLQKIQNFARDEMLNVREHPAITFTSESVRPTSPGRFEAKGTLTIRGVGRAAVVLVSFVSSAEGPLRFEGSAQIRLTDYGLKPPSAALGTIGTTNEMSFLFALTGHPEGSSGVTETASFPE